MIKEEDIRMEEYKLSRLIAKKNRMKKVELPEAENRVKMADTSLKSLYRRQYSCLTKKKNLFKMMILLGDLVAARENRDKTIKGFRELKASIIEKGGELKAMKVRKYMEETL